MIELHVDHCHEQPSTASVGVQQVNWITGRQKVFATFGDAAF
jgi:hypothetical protein